MHLVYVHALSVRSCFDIVLIILKIPECNYICNCLVTLLTHSLHKPNLPLTLPVSHLKSSKCFAIQYEHKYIVTIFWCKYIIVKAT